MSDDLDFAAESSGSSPQKTDSMTSTNSEPIRVRLAGIAPKKWSDLGDGLYRASGATVDRMPAGAYRVGLDNNGSVIYSKVEPITDELIHLPDSASERVLKSIETFWQSKEKFAAKKQIYKRGILMWGPPGSGKSALILQMVTNLIKKNGVVIYTSVPDFAEAALTQLRKVEPERHLICVLEDIDEMVARFGEHSLLSLLDGDTQIKNVVFIATTNYPDRLAKRIINRPSRFDLIVKVGMPSDASRRAYFRSRMTQEELSDTELEKWVTDTKDLSIAHLRELVVATFCLGNSYTDTIERLKKMDRTLNSSEGRSVGF